MIKFFKKIYYSVWADAINYERIKNGGEDHWKTFTFAYMSILMALNILAILSAFLYFTGYDIFLSMISKIEERITLNERLISIIWSILILFLPSLIFTYFSIFYKKKYKYILENYEFKNGKLLLIYFVVTIIAFFGFSLLNKFG
ncbi:hypothetical protein NHF50_07960 [Flavobacterium sp. NRK F10]|uniref:hypothetical protein n=1 Tax=Flavobacterium sp. NRK F10 TaxID=2954931 RepID=UPI0020903AD6|nr:hypothetical protein [Flavobacterium sp. NRK F10]MCO6174980.1 hypothetical protein [Flavobacterium sp. NRK F10]